jgi:hypothetical protein
MVTACKSRRRAGRSRSAAALPPDTGGVERGRVVEQGVERLGVSAEPGVCPAGFAGFDMHLAGRCLDGPYPVVKLETVGRCGRLGVRVRAGVRHHR